MRGVRESDWRCPHASPPARKQWSKSGRHGPGSDGYNNYVYDELAGGKVNSVMSIVVRALDVLVEPCPDASQLTSEDAADEEDVVAAVTNADAIFFAGGDQTLYVERIPPGSPLALALEIRGSQVTVGGTSAGNDFLSPIVYAPETDAPDIVSRDALRNPYAYGITFSPSVLDLDTFGGSLFLADAHFEQRDRMGRGLVFLARLQQDGLVPVGQCARLVAVNEKTALVVERVRLPRGEATLAGSSSAYICSLCVTPMVCKAGSPLTAGPYECMRLSEATDTFFFPEWNGTGVKYQLSVDRGQVVGDPYGP